MPSPKKKTLAEKMKADFKIYSTKKDYSFSKKTKPWIPKNSMAWRDMQKGRMITAEKLRNTELSPELCRMFANEAKNRGAGGWEPIPLMSVKVPIQPLLPNFERAPPANEQQILDILNRINTVFKEISKVLNLSLCACLERRKIDNSMCLFTYFKGFPWTLVGGIVAIKEEDVNKPPPPHSIYEAWRSQFFQSLQTLVPHPIFTKMKRSVDYGFDMEWCLNFVGSQDFREILEKIGSFKINPINSTLWTTQPMDYDPRNQDFTFARSHLIRQVEAEVKSFWTYDKIGVHLKMYFNSDIYS